MRGANKTAPWNARQHGLEYRGLGDDGIWPHLPDCTYSRCELAIINIVRGSIMDRLRALELGEGTAQVGGRKIRIPEARHIAKGSFKTYGPLFHFVFGRPGALKLEFENVFPDFVNIEDDEEGTKSLRGQMAVRALHVISGSSNPKVTAGQVDPQFRENLGYIDQWRGSLPFKTQRMQLRATRLDHANDTGWVDDDDEAPSQSPAVWAQRPKQKGRGRVAPDGSRIVNEAGSASAGPKGPAWPPRKGERPRPERPMLRPGHKKGKGKNPSKGAKGKTRRSTGVGNGASGAVAAIATWGDAWGAQAAPTASHHTGIIALDDCCLPSSCGLDQVIKMVILAFLVLTLFLIVVMKIIAFVSRWNKKNLMRVDVCADDMVIKRGELRGGGGGEPSARSGAAFRCSGHGSAASSISSTGTIEGKRRRNYAKAATISRL